VGKTLAKKMFRLEDKWKRQYYGNASIEDCRITLCQLEDVYKMIKEIGKQHERTTDKH
jgi:hypothetical protein